MKKLFVLFIAVMAIFLVVSCSTTKAVDVEPFVREVDLKPYVSKDYDADQVYKMVEKYVDDCYADDKSMTIAKDPAGHSIKVSGMEISALVGPLAQDGYIVVEQAYAAEANKAIITFKFVDAYTTIMLGPIEKKSSQGVTDLILDEINRQVDYVADAFAAAISTYVYYLDNGYLE